MKKNRFKDMLFELLNEHGEEGIELADINVCDVKSSIDVEVVDGSKFEIKVKKIRGCGT